MPSDPPYVEKRPEDERVALMEKVFLPREAWVLSGSMLGWGDDVVARCDAVVFLTLEPGAGLDRPVLRLDSAAPPEVLREEVVAWEPTVA